MKDGDKVRYYINPKEYIAGVVVEECGDSTVWVEHSNGQQRRYAENDLVLELGNQTEIFVWRYRWR